VHQSLSENVMKKLQNKHYSCEKKQKYLKQVMKIKTEKVQKNVKPEKMEN